MGKPGAICKGSERFFFFFVMNVCIIKLVSLRIGLEGKDDLIKGLCSTGEELFSVTLTF